MTSALGDLLVGLVERRLSEQQARRVRLAVAGVVLVLVVASVGTVLAVRWSNDRASDAAYAKHVEQVWNILVQNDDDVRDATKLHKEGKASVEVVRDAVQGSRADLAHAFAFAVDRRPHFDKYVAEEYEELLRALGVRSEQLDAVEACANSGYRDAYACGRASSMEEEVDARLRRLMDA